MVASLNKKKMIAGVIISAALFGAISGYSFMRNSTRVNNETTKRTEAFQESTTGLKLEYPSALQKATLTPNDTKSKILLRLTESLGERPMLVTIRSETGLRAVTTLTKQELLPLLMNNSEKAFPQRFQGYLKLSSRTFEINTTKAGELIFTYDSPGGGKAKQRFVIYPKDDNTVIYVAAQAQEKDFDALNQEIFDSVIGSLSF